METDEIIEEVNINNESGKEEKDTKETEEKPLKFKALKPSQLSEGSTQIRKVFVPNHRFMPLKNNWMDIYKPIVEYLKLHIRMNIKTKNVEIKTSKETEDVGALDRAVEFVRAFILGFEVSDALAILRLEDIFLDSFDVDDVKMLSGDHLSRAIGRIAGKDGKTKFAIENATRTRIVLADKKVHIMGSFQNIKIAKDAICQLILGSPPGKVYAKLRIISSRLKERF